MADERAVAVAASLPIERLRAEDVEVLEGDPADEATWMMQSAVALGLVLSEKDRAAEGVRGLGIDFDRLSRDALLELFERMGELGRKCFASSRYDVPFVSPR